MVSRAARKGTTLRRGDGAATALGLAVQLLAATIALVGATSPPLSTTVNVDLQAPPAVLQQRPPSSEAVLSQYHVVTVYENEHWGIKSGWTRPRRKELRQWTYHDGGLTLPPEELQLPDGWEWVSDWRVMRHSGTDGRGWRYAPGFSAFKQRSSGTARPGWGLKARRRGWVRVMRRISGGTKAEDAGMQLRDLLLERGLRDGGGALESMLVDEKAEFLAPDQVARVRPPAPPLWTANLRSWLKEEFTFKGFGLTVSKSLMARDVGVGFGIPLTPNFQWWERSDLLPTINSNVGMYFPFCVAGWISISYPADLLLATITQLWAHQPRTPRALRTSRKSVERLGVSISCRYTLSNGFFFRLTPWFFIMPGIPIIARFLAWLAMSFLGQLENLEDQSQRRWANHVSHDMAKARRHVLPAKRVKAWLAKKTTGMGWTMGVTKSGVGGSVLFSLSPFFLGLRKKRRHIADASRTIFTPTTAPTTPLFPPSPEPPPSATATLRLVTAEGSVAGDGQPGSGDVPEDEEGLRRHSIGI